MLKSLFVPTFALVSLAGLSSLLSAASAASEKVPSVVLPVSSPASAPKLPRLAAGLDFSDAAFTRAVVELEQCRDAQSRAERRAARGALSRKALEEFRDATRKAQLSVDKLRQLRAAHMTDGVTIVVDGGGINTFLPATTSSPILRPVVTPPANENITAPRATLPNVQIAVSALPQNEQSLPMQLLSATAPSIARPQLGHGEGSISAPSFGTRTQLELPRKTGEHPPMTPIASLPTAFKTVAPTPTIAAPLIVAPKPAPVPVTTVVAARPTPNSVKPAPNAPNDSRTRLAQLEAQLNHAERRLNAADAALSEGQSQLTQFAGTLRQAMLEAGPEATGLHPFVKIAEKYAGTPYVWGGESRGGFDCSGLIILVMRELGYKTPPHSAAEQFKYGVPIAQPLLKPGDLVFFANTYKPGISHVGIYLGKRRFIHAAGTGKGTIVSSLDTPHFQEKYAGGRRLVQAH